MFDDPQPSLPPEPHFPPRKKRHPLRMLWIALLVMFALFVIVMVIAVAGGGTSPASPPATPYGAPAHGDSHAAPAPAPTPAPVPAPTPVPEAAPVDPLTTFGDGMYVVGEDIAPGRYRNDGPRDSSYKLPCYWDVRDASGVIEPNGQGVAPAGPSVVTLKAGTMFTSRNCLDWRLS